MLGVVEYGGEEGDLIEGGEGGGGFEDVGEVGSVFFGGFGWGWLFG